MDWLLWIILGLAVGAGVGAYVGFTYRRNIVEKKIGKTEEYAKKLLDDATKKADEQKKEMLLEAKENILHE